MGLPGSIEQRFFHDDAGNNWLVPGVFIEVLWDIELSNSEGRRAGTRSVESTWWRAEVVNEEQDGSKCKAHLRYESRNGFEEQLGTVLVFPSHLRLVEDDTTQLRWGFYESSGNITYDDGDEADSFVVRSMNQTGAGLHLDRVRVLQEQVGEVMHRCELMEQMIVTQNHHFTQLLGTGSQGERRCAQLFATLRQKIAIMMQKPIPALKRRRETDESSIFFEDSCAGVLRVDVDCDYDTLQSIARVVRSKTKTACFRPSFFRI